MRTITSKRAVLWAALLLGLLPGTTAAQTLMWDRSPQAEVTGYRVLYGTSPRNYSSSVDVGNSTSYSLVNLTQQNQYYLAVQAYTAGGLVSAPSGEVPFAPSRTTISDLRANAAFPLLIGNPVTWTATASNNQGAVEYQFWVFGRNGWTIVRDYAPANTFTWTPGWDDQHASYLQVWVRRAGSTAQYEAYRASDMFTVRAAALELKADVDFPTPPGNPVRWSATVAGAGTTPMEYQFWAFSSVTGQWSIIRSYSSANEVVWTPTQVGQHAVQVWVRRVGSTAQYDLYNSSGMVDVARTPATVTLRSDRQYPLETGTSVTWTARVRGGTAGPLQYQFWMHSPTRGWVIAQPYGPSPRFTWTPGWGDGGSRALQVWVRNSGSTADYDAYAATGFFAVNQAPLHLSTETLFPAAPGTTIEWVASAGGAGSLRYQFWVYTQATGRWTIGQPYSSNARFLWQPPATGTYSVQVWARTTGSTEDYQAWHGTDYFAISSGPAAIRSLGANVALPARATGNGITWTARGTGGTGPLQYQFWMLDEALATWTIVQPYGTNNRFTWTPTAADAGRYAVQVWVRSPGSTAAYDAWMGTEFFTIQP